VNSDVFGVSGRKLLKRLIHSGYVDAPDVEASIHRSVTGKKTEDYLFSFRDIK